MHVLQIHNEYALPGGEDTIANAEARLLREAGYEVETLRVRNSDHGVDAARSLVAAPWNPARARAIRERVRQAQPDVVHVHNTWFTLSPSIFAAIHREHVPIVMTIQNFRLLCAEAKLFRGGGTCTECVGTHPWRAVKYSCYRGSKPASVVAAATIAINRSLRTWDKVDRFLVPSEFVKGVFVNAGFEPGRLIVKPNVVDDPGPRVHPPSASRTVVYVGRLAPEKGVKLLLDAFQRDREGSDDLELAIVGDGPQRAELEALAGRRVRFCGWVGAEQVAKQLSTARALLFPTQWSENFGRVIVEAMAAGTPVLASDIATPAEIVGELGPQWLVPPRDPAAWTAAMGRLSDGSVVDAAGARARALFARKYTAAVGVHRLIEVYEQARASQTERSSTRARSSPTILG